jgi:hypothetical protein
MPRTTISSIESEYRRYKALAEGAVRQLTDTELFQTPGEADNSVAVICRHVAGNLRSRFTDFLTSDGEKIWRDRESEFASAQPRRREIVDLWDTAWRVLATTLADLTDADLGRTVTIRKQPLSVLEALHRSLAHASYHVGQIVFLAKHMRGTGWQYLSIPPGGSSEYNANPTLERGPRPSAGG